MPNNRAIPPGYMTVGEFAEKMGVTVRTLQYYDREGLLAPSGESAGGRRLYNSRDIVQLHQILSLKHLGFSLDDIKNRLIPLDTPAQVAQALAEQAAAIREKIKSLSESLRETEALQAEVLQMQTVDFKKYADIIVNLQMKNEFYWMIKLFDDASLEKMRTRYDLDSGQVAIDTFHQLLNKAEALQAQGIPPESGPGQQLAQEFWNFVMEFTQGDQMLLKNLMRMKTPAVLEGPNPQNLGIVRTFFEPALSAYFDALGYDPLEETT